MNTVTYSSFTEDTKHYLDIIDASHQEIVVLKDKKPAFRVLPINSEEPSNLLKNSILFEADLLSPINDSWEVE